MPGTINERFHAKHPMPQRATETDRLAWHLEHAKRCGCRPIPDSLSELAHPPDRPRCAWAGDDPLMIRYHDTEWGVPSHDDRHLFEMLILEGAQAGLSWRTILWKRENYRKAFAGFDPKKVARFDARATARLMDDPGIVRNRLKVESTVLNAKAVLAVQKQHGSLAKYLWTFVNDAPIVTCRQSLRDVPAKTAESDAMSRALTTLGFKFVGSTICYAFMQACGLVDDHVESCFKAQKTRAKRARR
jgi:DNA-3-methyladenine glycosylase I